MVEIAVQDSQVPDGFSLDMSYDEDSEEQGEEQSMTNKSRRKYFLSWLKMKMSESQTKAENQEKFKNLKWRL